MSNMRGRGFEPTGDQQHLINMLRNGQTYGQQREQRLRHTALGLISGGINLAGGIASGRNAYVKEQETKNRHTMRDAIDSQTKRDYEMRNGPLPQYDSSKNMATESGVAPPAWLGEHGSGEAGFKYSGEPNTDDSNYGGSARGPVDLSLPGEARAAQDRLRANGAAMNADIGGYHTTGGLDSAHNESGVQAQDMNTGKDIMKTGGGLMNSRY